MHDFKELAALFGEHFSIKHFPGKPESLYEPANYFLSWGGKRIRPVMCLMGNELFGEITADTYEVATAIELFHNFTLIHDDIMDQAPLRRGMETVHTKYGPSTALLAGDVMMIRAYDYLAKVHPQYLQRLLVLFNRTAREVCEGQQLDIDFEQRNDVSMEEYIEMIGLKTSVLLAASLEMGAILGGTSEGNCRHIYEFGKNLGIAFQVQDDYLDAFGDPEKFGKETGGDIRQNKKTVLLLRALAAANEGQRAEINELLKSEHPGKVDRMLRIFRDCGADTWAIELKDRYLQTALQHLDDIAVVSSRKKPLHELANFLVQREY